MIYLVTKDPKKVSCEEYKIIDIIHSLELLEPLSIVGLDTETTGLNCWNDQLKSIQLGCFEFQIVIDCLTISPSHYKPYLESNRLFIGHNIKFDLCFLYRNNIYPENVYDTFTGEKLLWLGYPPILKPDVWDRIQCKRYTPILSKDGSITKYQLELNLKKLGKLYLNIELDKSVRGRIIYEGLTTEVIIYSANDVKYLEPLMEAQKKALSEKGLLTAIKYENAFIPALAYMEYCGVKLNVEKWKNKMLKDQQRLEKALQGMNQWLIQNMPNSKYIIYNTQGDLFTGFSSSPKITLNWNSNAQLIPIFKQYGVDVTVVKKGEQKESIDAKVLEAQKDKCSLIPLYIDYKESMKLISTYGQNFIDQINKTSGRLHTKFMGIGTDTSRISSGGKESNGNQLLNFLNIPADAKTRACFEAEEGNQWISIDYAGQETYLMASIADDKAIIEELTNGSGDIHSLTAYMSFKDIPRETNVKDIKKLYHDKRQSAKGIEFAINYGGDANTIHQNSHLPLKQCVEIYNNYMSGFSGLAKYQKFRRKDWWDKGYILLNPKTGHKAFIYDYNALKKEYDSFQEKGFWEYYNDLKKSNPSSYTVQKVKNFFKRKSASEKQSINYPIQFAGAACYKVSMINFFKYIKENNLLNVVKICVTPYDEINCEAPKEIAEEVASKLYQCMVQAGSYFCTRCKLDADISRLPNGNLPTYWIH